MSNAKQLTVLTGRVFIAAMQRGTLLNRLRPGDVVVVGDQNEVQLELIRIGLLRRDRDRQRSFWRTR